MIALTQERKIALIEHADEIKDRLSEYGYPFQPHKTKQLLDIALSSLTAVPFGWEIAGSIFPTLEEALRPGYIGTPEPIYDEPPVPEIKLPDDHEGTEHTDYHSGKKDGWNMCLAEIKRLNGLGE